MNTMMKRLVGCFCLFMSLALASQAGQYWWDADGAGANLGGSGNWDTSSSLWRTPGSTDALTTWNNDGTHEAVFTNAAGTVTLGATKINVNKMNFIGSTQSWTFNSGTLDFGSGGSVAITNDDHVSINSGVTGAGTLMLTTSKSTWARGVRLYGNNSAFTGKLVVQKTAGTYFWLYATNDFNFGAVPAVYTADALTFNGVNLQTASGITLNISTNRGITLGSGGLSFNNQALCTLNLNSKITGSGALTFDASTGVINLNAVNDYAGTMSFQGGKTVIGIDGALPHGTGKGDIWFRCWNSAVTLDLNGHVVTINAVYDQGGTYSPSSCIDNSAAGPATLIVGDGNTGNTFPRTIKNTGGALSLTKIGTGTQTFTGTNSYAGATTVNAGTLVFSGALTNVSPLVVNGGSLQADLSVITDGVFNSSSSLTLAGGTINIKGKSSGASAQVLGTLTVNSGGGTISITPNGGAGTTLTLGNTWTRQAGGTVLADISAVGSALTSGPTLTNGIIGGYAFVKDNAGIDFATVTSGNIVRYTGATLLDATAAANNLDGTVNYYLTNYQTLTGAATTQTVNSIRFNQAGLTIGSGKVLVVGSGGIISSNSSVQNITGGTLTAGGSDLVIYVTSAGNLRLYSPISDNGHTVGVTILGGTVRMQASSANTYTGDTVVNQGGSVLSVYAIPYGNGRGNVLINAGGYVEMAGGSGSINGLSQSTNNAGGTVRCTYGGPVTLTLGNGDATASFSGVIAGTGANALTLNKVGAGTQTLSGISTYSGGTILSNGVLSVSSLDNIGGANAKVTFAGGTLRITGTNFTGFEAMPVTVAGDVGLDIVESSNAFTFTNDVPGTLTKTGDGSLGVSGSVESLVTDSRTLVSGSGSVAAWTLKSLTGGAYTPAGIEAVTGTLTLEGNYTFDLNADGSGDKLTASGAVTMNSIVVTIPAPNSSLTDRSKIYTLVQGSSLSGSFSLASVLPQDWKLKKEGNALVVRYVSPGTMVSFF